MSTTASYIAAIFVMAIAAAFIKGLAVIISRWPMQFIITVFSVFMAMVIHGLARFIQIVYH